jgi:CheY-like chemotaxis protein
MGGAIEVESTPGQGTSVCFTLTLAASDADAVAAGTVAPAPSAAGSARILVAEDVPINQDLARELLESLGHVVDVVSTGAEAVAAVQKTSYDLVLMDVYMPEMDGLAATRAIRALDHPAKSVPIVACTANVLPVQVAQIREAGVDGHIGKPLRRADLQGVVSGFASSSKSPAPVAEGAAEADQHEFEGMVRLLGPQKIGAALALAENDLRGLLYDDSRSPAQREALARRAHALISTARLLGMTALAEQCSELQQACGDPQALGQTLERLKPALASALARFQQLRGVLLRTAAASDAAPSRSITS